jgi:hypothetical protein
MSTVANPAGTLEFFSRVCGVTTTTISPNLIRGIDLLMGRLGHQEDLEAYEETNLKSIFTWCRVCKIARETESTTVPSSEGTLNLALDGFEYMRRLYERLWSELGGVIARDIARLRGKKVLARLLTLGSFIPTSLEV